MGSERKSFEEAAASISDGADVDWDAVDSGATTEEEKILAGNLKVIAGISRSLQAPEDPDLRRTPAIREGVLSGPLLEVDVPGGGIHHHPLVAERTTIGRSSVNHLIIPDLALSRHHAVVQSRDGRYEIEDLGSRNGTYVNEQPVRDPVRLEDGDQIRFGSCRAFFFSGETAGRVPPGREIEEITWPGERRVAAGAPGQGESIESICGTEPSSTRLILGHLFPSSSPEVDGYRFLGDTLPCYEAGADFFDCQVRPDGRIGILVGDVARRGFRAALLGLYTQALLRGLLEHERAPQEAIAKVNRDVCRRFPPNQFVTLSLCLLHPGSGDLIYVNAGHPPPVIIHGGGSKERLEGSNLPLGIDAGVSYRAGRSHLAPGSMLVLYTDGVIGCHEAAGRGSGEDWFETFLAARKDSPPERIMLDLEAELERLAGGSPPPDDITIVLAQRLPLIS